MERREIIDKYVQIYHKRNIQLAIFCATLVFTPLFVVSLFYDVVPEDTLISFFPFLLAIISVGILKDIKEHHYKYKQKSVRFRMW